MKRAPYPIAPSCWVTIDPAGCGARKPSLAVVWEETTATRFVVLDVSAPGWWLGLDAHCPDMLVLEEGFARAVKGVSPKSIADLAETRGRLHAWAQLRAITIRRVLPDQWRRVLRLPARGKQAIAEGQRRLCRELAEQLPGGTMPRVELAAQATNDDKRAALLIGVAAILAWRWVDG